MAKAIPHCSRSCDDHALWGAHAPTPSADGTRVYVICTCGRPRVVAPHAWQAEAQRRAQESEARKGAQRDAPA